MSDPLATIASYWSLENYAVQRSALEAAGIETFADDHFIISINWLNANAMHGIKLRVAAEDVDAASDVIAGAAEIGEPETLGEQSEECPACGSTALEAAPKWPAMIAVGILVAAAAIAAGYSDAAFLLMVSAIFVALMAPRRRCSDCGESL